MNRLKFIAFALCTSYWFIKCLLVHKFFLDKLNISRYFSLKLVLSDVFIGCFLMRRLGLLCFLVCFGLSYIVPVYLMFLGLLDVGHGTISPASMSMYLVTDCSTESRCAQCIRPSRLTLTPTPLTFESIVYHRLEFSV